MSPPPVTLNFDLESGARITRGLSVLFWSSQASLFST